MPRAAVVSYRDVGSMQLGMSAGACCWLLSWAGLRLGVAFVPRGICRSTYRSISIWAGHNTFVLTT
jgi:hypothetical protein